MNMANNKPMKPNENAMIGISDTKNNSFLKYAEGIDENSNINCHHSKKNGSEVSKYSLLGVTGKSPCGRRCLSKVNKLPPEVNLSPLSIDVTSYPDPELWDHKYVSEIVDYVVKRFCTNRTVRLRWHPSEYDSMTGPQDIYFGIAAKWIIDDILDRCELWFYHKFCNIMNLTGPVDQSTFDAAITLFYHHHASLYYSNFLVYQLASGITMFAIYSTFLGFSDALYHAVHLIVHLAKTLKRDSRTYSTTDLVSVFRGSLLMTSSMILSARTHEFMRQAIQIVWTPF